MNKTLIGIVALIYLGVAISFYLKKDYPMMIVFTAYAISNIGFILIP